MEAGVVGYIVKPFRESELVPAIEVGLARFGEFRAIEKELGDTREALETRKVVERARACSWTAVCRRPRPFAESRS